MSRAIVPLIIIPLLFSCKLTRSPGNASNIKLIGSSEVGEGQWPEVRRLDVHQRLQDGIYSLKSTCTTTFIAPHVALTAAHCVCHADKLTFKRDWAHEYTVTRVEKSFGYDCNIHVPGPRDMALLFFNEDVQMPYLKVVNQIPAIGEKMTLVGYGNSVLKVEAGWFSRKVATEGKSPSTGGQGDEDYFGKQLGSATYAGERAEDGMIRFNATLIVTSPLSSEQDEAALAEGDSGGPLIRTKDRAIVAVASRGGFKALSSHNVQAISDYAAFAEAENAELLKRFQIPVE